MPTDNFGSATLSTAGGGSDFATYFDQTFTRGQPGFFMGLDLTGPHASQYGSVWFPEKYRGMGITFGSARSGKGAGTIIPALMGYGGNVLCLDVKAELAWITAQRRRDLGQRAVIVDPFGELNRAFGTKAGVQETITRYNPLSILDPHALTFPDDVAGLCEGVVVDDVGGSANSNYFNLSARELAIGLVAAEVQEAYHQGQPELATLRNVREMINMEDTEFAEGMKLICDKYPGTLAAKKLAQYQPDRSGNLSEGNQAIKNTLKQQTAFLDSEELLRGMEPAPGEASFNFSKLCNGRISIYLVLPASYIETHARWFRMMISQAVRTVLRLRGNVALPILMLCDEAGTSLGRLPVIEMAYGLTSGMGLLVWSFYQDISQLRRDYPHSWQTFIGNSAMVQVVGAGDNDTLQYFSTYLGTKTVPAPSTSSGQNFSQGGGGFNEGTSIGETGRPVMLPLELRDMNENNVIIVYPRHEQFRLRKLQYFSDGRLTGMYRPDPHYPPPPPRIPTRALTQADLDAMSVRANTPHRKETTTGKAHDIAGALTGFLQPAAPYSGSRKIGLLAAFAFWCLFLYSIYIQGKGYGFNLGPYAFFCLATGLLLWALKDTKHRAAVLAFSCLVLFWSSDFSRGLMYLFRIQVQSSVLGLLFWNGIFGIPLFELVVPFFLFDPKFRQFLVLLWRNGFSRQGLLLTVVMRFDSWKERLRVTIEAGVFVFTTISVDLHTFAHLQNTLDRLNGGPGQGPAVVAILFPFLAFLQLPIAVLLIRFAVNTLRRPSLRAHDIKY